MNKLKLRHHIYELSKQLNNVEEKVYLIIDSNKVKVGYTKRALTKRMKDYETTNPHFQLCAAIAGSVETETYWRNALKRLGCVKMQGRTERYEWRVLPKTIDRNALKHEGFAYLTRMLEALEN